MRVRLDTFLSHLRLTEAGGELLLHLSAASAQQDSVFWYKVVPLPRLDCSSLFLKLQ